MHPSHWHKSESVLTLFGCCTGRAAARKWPVVVTVAWSRGLDRDTAALLSGSDPGRRGSSCSLAVGGTDWWQALASESASATFKLTRNLNVPATECDSFRCRPGDVTGRRDSDATVWPSLTVTEWRPPPGRASAS